MTPLFLQHSIPDLVAKISAGDLHSEDLLATVHEAIAAFEPQTHAWVCHDVKNAGERSLPADAVNPRWLEGIPFGIKDIFNTKDFPTEMGSAFWKGFTPGNNARAVDAVRRAGGIPIGKTVTAEFAVHALNDTLNPHGAAFTPGTSSSGSAAAVARGMVPFALGTQTAGSIVRPASFCGVWGMKPSFGMIPRTGVLKTTDSLDTVGFLCAHGKSLRPVLNSLRVRGPDYPFVFRHVDLPGEIPKDIAKPWRVGFVKTHVWQEALPYARESMTNLVDRLSGNPKFQVEEVFWPAPLEQSHATHATIYAKSLSYYFQQEAEAGTEISPIMASMIEDGRKISSAEFLEAIENQEDLARAVDALFEPYDFVISLGTSSSAPLRHEPEIPDPSLIWTLCHVPSVAMPTDRCPAGMPFGIQIVSRKYSDYLLLQAVEAMIDEGFLPAGSMGI
jgi:Asp-tRNA(Asn)/Glu-tRNA(Gln) amidotransferase A subunit family amidase